MKGAPVVEHVLAICRVEAPAVAAEVGHCVHAVHQGFQGDDGVGDVHNLRRGHEPHWRIGVHHHQAVDGEVDRGWAIARRHCSDLDPVGARRLKHMHRGVGVAAFSVAERPPLGHFVGVGFAGEQDRQRGAPARGVDADVERRQVRRCLDEHRVGDGASAPNFIQGEGHVVPAACIELDAGDAQA